MKKHLAVIFIFLSIVVLVMGLKLNIYWNGILGWGLSCICLLLAAYFSKYIPNEKCSKDTEIPK